ncbi:putative magnesium transporter NIPA7, partial [Mucuna pruriens]
HFLLKERLPKMGCWDVYPTLRDQLLLSSMHHNSRIWIMFKKYRIWPLNQTNMLVYLGICSLVGSLMVVSIKDIGIAIKLTLDGISQIAYPHTWFVLTVATMCHYTVELS